MGESFAVTSGRPVLVLVCGLSSDETGTIVLKHRSLRSVGVGIRSYHGSSVPKIKAAVLVHIRMLLDSRDLYRRWSAVSRSVLRLSEPESGEFAGVSIRKEFTVHLRRHFCAHFVEQKSVG